MVDRALSISLVHKLTQARAAAQPDRPDRDWGRTPRQHAGEDGNDNRVVIRKVVGDGDAD
jgi:hypothetical protein